jgi:hypothetical protein
VLREPEARDRAAFIELLASPEVGTYLGGPRPSVPSEAYLALAGATAELVRSVVRAGRTDALPELEETLVSPHLAVLAARPWPPA